MPKSIADYSRAIALNAGYVDAYYNRGLVLSAMGDKPGAIADYTQVIRLDRNFAAAYNNRGLALSDLGDQKGAIDDFNQALQINPGRANTYFNRGLALFRINNDRSALADYTHSRDKLLVGCANNISGTCLYFIANISIALQDWRSGNPLLLNTAAAAIQDLFNGNVSDFLSYDSLVLGDLEYLLHQHFQRLSDSEKQVMSWLANQNKAVEISQKPALLELSPSEFLKAVESLRRRLLIEKVQKGDPTLFTLQRAIAEYVKTNIK